VKAVRIHKHGGPEVLRYESVEDPRPGSGQVLVRLRAAGVNYRDIEGRRGFRGARDIRPRITLPLIPGADGAGVVAEIGSDVRDVRVGDEVITTHTLSCGHCGNCLRGRDELCLSRGAVGIERPGTYAEYIVVPRVNVLPKPARLDFEGAATLNMVLITAWPMLVTRGRVTAGEDVLVHAAGSGIGCVSIQIAKAFGARVIATASSEAKRQRALEIGADHAIPYDGFVENVMRLTGGRGVDLVAEAIGGKTFTDSIGVLATEGRIVTCASGSLAGEELAFHITHARERRCELIFSQFGAKWQLIEALRLVEQGRIEPVVHAVLPLSDASTAQRMLENRKQFGKIVLAIG
jgi:NADPH:quinone reductase-like Zn-dependent oxidoreductase